MQGAPSLDTLLGLLRLTPAQGFLGGDRCSARRLLSFSSASPPPPPALSVWPLPGAERLHVRREVGGGGRRLGLLTDCEAAAGSGSCRWVRTARRAGASPVHSRGFASCPEASCLPLQAPVPIPAGALGLPSRPSAARSSSGPGPRLCWAPGRGGYQGGCSLGQGDVSALQILPTLVHLGADQHGLQSRPGQWAAPGSGPESSKGLPLPALSSQRLWPDGPSAQATAPAQ